MIDPIIGKAAFHIGFFIVFCSGFLLIFVERGTAEFYITQITFAIGATFLIIVAILARLSQRDG